ncbi:hypothetical protein F4778DRAFT_801459 [Xylariomycetidae sp. FL2044]|nr:hypothetical protein F4778DRAFT_801459 [Xylariomycetidae sp. FL2044]
MADLQPDGNIILAVLNITNGSLPDYRVISSSFDTRTAKIHFESAPTGYPTEVVLRLESSGSNLSDAVALQAMAHAQLPDLVPFVLKFGFVTTDKRKLQYSIVSYYMDTVTAEEYSLFKQQTMHLLPRSTCHAKPIQAIRIMYESKRRGVRRNVGVVFQAKWLAREMVEWSPDVRLGWVANNGPQAARLFTKENADLESAVLKELGYA